MRQLSGDKRRNGCGASNGPSQMFILPSFIFRAVLPSKVEESQTRDQVRSVAGVFRASQSLSMRQHKGLIGFCHPGRAPVHHTILLRL